MTTDEMRKNYDPSEEKIDGISVVLALVFSAIIGVVASTVLSILAFNFLTGAGYIIAAIGLGILLAVFFFIYSLSKIQKVPESYEWIIEFWGGFHVIWAAGGHIYFPWFGWLSQREEVFLGEEDIELFPDLTDLIDFEDASCHLKASITIKVRNSLLAVYNIDHYKEAVRKRMAGLLRASLSKFTLEKANEEKHELDLGFIITGVKQDPNVSEEDQPYKKKKFYTDFIDDWGVDVLKLMVGDIVLPPEDVARRQRKQEAAVNKEVAMDNKKTTIINAEAEAEAIKKLAEARQYELQQEGLGIEAQIKALISAGLTKEAATALVVDRFKWSQIGDKSLIIDGGGVAGDGAKFGAGMNKGNNI